ncbi:MAG: hypothetical protein ACLGIP_18055, partial [Alphaproteobacteria bacterium]
LGDEVAHPALLDLEIREFLADRDLAARAEAPQTFEPGFDRAGDPALEAHQARLWQLMRDEAEAADMELSHV